jgi:uncharacterized integral membrane protein
MRFVYVALIVVFTGIVALFKFQNLEMVTISLLTARFTLPVSVLVFLVYVLGMLTGGSLRAFLRTWVTRAGWAGRYRCQCAERSAKVLA